MKKKTGAGIGSHLLIHLLSSNKGNEGSPLFGAQSYTIQSFHG
jgi:hypothetical protein